MQVIQLPAAVLDKPRPATSWLCELTDADGKRFRLSGRFDEVPAGANPYNPLPTLISGDGPAPLLGKNYFTPGAFTDAFRDYEVFARGNGRAAHRLRFALRRGGHGLVNVLRLNPPEPYDHVATGLCTSDFGKAS
jgi:hypothetical protein